MSNFNPSKELLPLRKALKNIKNNLQLIRHCSKIVSIINTARKRCIVFSRFISRLIYTKFRTLTNRPRLSSNHSHHSYQNFSVIYIDELFQGKTLAKPFATKENMVPSSSTTTSTITKLPQAIKTTLDVPNLRKHRVSAESSKNHENGLFVGKGKAKSDGTWNDPAAADRWKNPLLPRFRGIDERAEEFIAMFRQDMKLQREQSILDFEEMLKRSV